MVSLFLQVVYRAGIMVNITKKGIIVPAGKLKSVEGEKKRIPARQGGLD